MEMDSKYIPELCSGGPQVFCNPFLDVERKLLVATNGHIFIAIPVTVEEGKDCRGYITSDALEYARKVAKRTGQKISIKARRKTLAVGNTIFKRPPCNDFPDLDYVLKGFPTSQKDIVFGMDSKYIKSITRALNPGKSEYIYYRFNPNETDKKCGHAGPIGISFKPRGREGSNQIAVIMPVRYTDLL